MSKPDWVSTLVFRHFRAKLTELSKLYWTSQLGHDALRQVLAGAAPGTLAVDGVASASFKKGMLWEVASQLLSNLEHRAEIERVHLLVICSASLEAYLQDIVRLWVAAQGHGRGAGKLTPVGEALASPVTRSSTVPAMLEYAEELLGISLGGAVQSWQRGYKLRCAAAHNGGVVSPKLAKQIPELAKEIGQPLRLSWETLRAYMNSAEKAAGLIDKHVSTQKVRATEVRWILDEMKEGGLLPKRGEVWSVLHEKYGLSQIGGEYKKAIEIEFYGIR